MQIYVGKSGQQLGPFSLEEINRKLADRTFVGTDLAWYEGAAGWAPLSGVAGVVLPPAGAPAPSPAAPTPAPAPAPAAPTAPVAVPVRSNASIVQPPVTASGGTRTLAMVSWILLGVTLVISFIPVLGCGSWILMWPVAVAVIIMGIIILTRGGTGQGIGMILGAVLLVPLSFLAQFASLTLFGNALSDDRKYQTQIMENLRTVDTAKSQFVTQTKAADGAPVTMASLASYLSGKEIKPAVGEQYDPMPVGQAPTATLPATKSLGNFKGGDVLTAVAIEKDLASSAFSWSSKTTKTWSSGGTSPTPTVIPATSPKATITPASTPSPKPSISPKSSSPPPRSLISPRQSTEPEESPSSQTRPSPSAKFAPRDGPRMGPRQSPSEPEQSGGLRQGKQRPGAGDAPSPTPEDGDE